MAKFIRLGCLLGLFLIVFQSVPTEAREPYDSLRARIEYFEGKLGPRDLNTDLREIAGFLGQGYSEVYAITKKQIILDCQSGALQAERLLAWLSVLDSVSSSKDSRFFAWVKKELRKNFPDDRDVDVIISEIERYAAAARAKGEGATLPSFEQLDLAQSAERLPSLPNRGASDSQLEKFKTVYDSEKFSHIRTATLQNLTSDLRKRQLAGKLNPVVGRDVEIDATIDVLLRLKGKAPVLLGQTGVGKTTVVEGVAERLLRGTLPQGFHSEKLKDAVVLVTNPSKIAQLVDDPSPRSLAIALNYYLQNLKTLEKSSGSKLILVIENAHQLGGSQVDVLKQHLDQSTIPVIMVADSKQAAFGFMADEQFQSRISPITIGELDDSTTFSLIKSGLLRQIESHYQIRIPDEVVRGAIELSTELQPDLKRPDGPIKLLQDAAIYASRSSNGTAGEVTLTMLYELAATRARLPVVPQDRTRFIAHMDEVRSKIKLEVRGQDPAVDHIVDLFAATMTSKGKSTRAAVVVGTTGTGKSLIASRLVHHFYGTPTRMLKIDGNQLKTDDSGFYLFGPKSGYIGSDKNKGLLATHFDGPGRGSSIVVVDELDKMHPQQVERLMEIIDTGEFIAGDGKQRSTGRVLWLFTSNKGATKFFPPEFVKTATVSDIQQRLKSISEAEIREAFTQQESFSKSGEVLKPEILSRFDEMILVAPILKETALEIGKIKVQDEILNFKRQGLGAISVGEGFVRAIVDESYDPVYGVRELERNIRNKIGELYDRLVKEHGVFKAITIETLMPLPGTSTVRFQAINERGQKIEVQGPKLAFENPLFDPVERENLKNLETNLNSKVFGQTFYAKKLAESIQKNVVDAGSPKPVSIYALGMTGNGKTEMARALSVARFGSTEFLCKLEMGQISSVKDLSNIFQSSVGYIGSDQPGQFERFLQTHKKGIILFDEMGNAGGNDKNAKEEIGKYLYSILDDGVWVSPVTKKTYALKDYVFIFTGNEAERIFSGSTQDDLLHSTWKAYSSETKARELLRSSGLSPAFVGRIGSVILTEPPVTETKESIVRKLLQEWVNRVESKQPVRLVYDDVFVSLVSKLTYSATEGARSVINFVNTTLGSAASKGIFEVDFSQATFQNRADIRLSLEVKIPEHPFYRVIPDETLAKLVVTVGQGGRELARIDSDFTASARFIKQIRMVDAYATAFHEAGHAILNDPATSGRILAHLTIIPADHYLGYARYEDLKGFKTNYTLTDLRARLATLVAGSEAELMVGREMNSGQSGDLEQERELLTRAATEWGLVPELMGVKLDPKGLPLFSSAQERIFNRFADREISLARETARKFLEEHWVLEYKVAEELMKHGQFSGERLEEIRQEVLAMSADTRAQFSKDHSAEKVKKQLSELDQETCSALMKTVKKAI